MDDNTLRIIIADDEVPAREEILHLLESIEGIEVVGVGKNGNEALSLYRSKGADLLLLDIEMPMMNGMELATTLSKEENCPLIIFTTAYDSYALRAFEVHALDYLLKPIRKEKLEKALIHGREKLKLSPSAIETKKEIESLVSDLLEARRETKKVFLSVYCGEAIIPLTKEEVLFAEAKGRHVWVTTAKGEYKRGI